MDVPTRAAIYLRISLDRTGEELAVARQNEDCQAIAESRGWTVVETYTDNSVSASKRTVRRPAYERMVDDFKAGKFDALVCYDLDRLTRQPRQLEDWIEAAEERGLLLVTANGEADLTTDGGRMFARIKASVARAEVERKSARQKRAAQQRADRGKAPGGPRLTGYDLDGGIVKAEAELVHRLFSDFAAGESLVALAKATDRTPSTVRTILTNPRYPGRAIYRGATTGKAGDWKPIVSEALFDAVQARLSDPRRITNRYGTDRKHLGSGLYLCGVCDRLVRTNGPRYWCPTGGHITRTLAAIDEYVIEAITARLERPDIASLSTVEDHAALNRADSESRELRSRLAAVESDYDAGLIDGTRYSVASEKILAQLRQLETERARELLGGAATSVLSGKNPAQDFARASLAGQRAVIAALATVRLLTVPRGRKGFDLDTVQIDWKHP